MPIKRAIALLSCLLACAPATASEFVLDRQLSGLAAECSITGSTALLTANSTTEVNEAFQRAEACSNDAKPKGREAYRAALQAHPDMQQRIGDLYSAWLGYIDELQQPRRLGSPESAAERDYKRALNQIRAALDAR